VNPIVKPVAKPAVVVSAAVTPILPATGTDAEHALLMAGAAMILIVAGSAMALGARRRVR